MLPCLALGFAFARPASAGGTALSPDFKAQLVSLTSGQVGSYYAYGDNALWIDAGGTLDPAADEFVKLIQTADEDGLDPATLHASELAAAVAQARADGTPAALAKAEALLSQTFAAYVGALRDESGTAMQYENMQLAPRFLGAYYTLVEAAKAPSLAEYIHDMPWMHPLYAPLRHVLMTRQDLSPQDRQLVLANLDRIRQIPAQPNGRHIIIDSADATLTMYDGDKIVDSMKVVVGKPDKQTPAYGGYIRYAFVNPYWNVPDDFVSSLIARNVLSQGMAYLKRQGYEVLSGWESDAQMLDPLKVDWAAVRRGDKMVHVRQLPGPRNSMGKIKFEFPNPYGIYLHDTPEKDLLDKDNRQLSAGCIRLQDAKRLGAWLMGGEIKVDSSAPEQKLDLPQPVPVYVTYLTAHVDDGQLKLSADPYARDHTTIASSK